MMKTKEWAKRVLQRHKDFQKDVRQLEACETKKQLFDFLMEINRCEFFLTSLGEYDDLVNYKVLSNELKNFINGNYIAKVDFYTNSMYVSYEKSSKIDIDTDIIVLLNCKNIDLYVKQGEYARIYVDTQCDIKIHCPSNARAIVEYWGTPTIEVDGNYERVELCQNF